MATISPIGKSYYYDSNGDPLNGGKVYTYEAGTTTPKVTYTTQDETTANTNPVILAADGSANIWLGDGGYKFMVTNSVDVEQFTADNLGGSSSAAFGGSVNTITVGTPITDVYANSVNIVTAAVTLSLLSVTAADEGFYFTVQNNSGGNVTIDPDGAETINGATSYVLADGGSAMVICNGTTWYTVLATPTLGTIATQNADSVAITGGTITGITDLAVADGGTGGSDAATAQTNLGVYSTTAVDALIDRIPVAAVDLTASAGSAPKTLLDSLPAGVTEVFLYVNGLSISGTDNVLFQLSDGSFITTGYEGSSSTFSASVISTSVTSGFAVTNVIAAAVINGTVRFKKEPTTNVWHCTISLSRGDGTAVNYRSEAIVSLSSALEGIRINVSGSNTFDAGSISAEYYTSPYA